MEKKATIFIRLKNDTSKRFEEMSIDDWAFTNKWTAESGYCVTSIHEGSVMWDFWWDRIVKWRNSTMKQL